MPVLLKNGNMLVPLRFESEDGVIGDGSEEITPDTEDYLLSIPWLPPADRKRAEAFAVRARHPEKAA